MQEDAKLNRKLFEIKSNKCWILYELSEKQRKNRVLAPDKVSQYTAETFISNEPRENLLAILLAQSVCAFLLAFNISCFVLQTKRICVAMLFVHNSGLLV